MLEKLGTFKKDCEDDIKRLQDQRKLLTALLDECEKEIKGLQEAIIEEIRKNKKKLPRLKNIIRAIGHIIG